MANQPLAQSIARSFSSVLREWLTKEQMNDVVARNAVEKRPGVCHTHDFIDANMAMQEAFERNEVKTGADIEEQEQPGAHEAACNLWNEAWGLAKRAEFDPARVA